MPLNSQSPLSIAKGLASRVQLRRLQLGWSRENLGRRSGVSAWTLKAFERNGQISLGTLIKLAIALDETQGLLELFPARAPIPSTMRELERLHQPIRKRGRA